MKRTTYFAILIAATAAAAMAQEATVPVAEVGMNFSATTINPGAGASLIAAPGGSGTFVYNLNKYVGAVADLGAYHNASDLNFNPTMFTYLFGPRLTFRKSRVSPYVQTLFGGARLWTNFADPVTGLTAPQNGFAAAFGGGMDLRITDHVTAKPFQVEYLMTRLTNPWATSGTQNNVRYSAGIVFTFGSR